ncbi:hypothetical protein F4810DRAFT_484796 [Camillea tinctor]|nr:hypothetical protein F4810DRAFT_484796 [Camillea tinctor]
MSSPNNTTEKEGPFYSTSLPAPPASPAPPLPPLPPLLPSLHQRKPSTPSQAPTNSKRAAMACKFGAASKPNPEAPMEITKQNFKPCYLFFYGSLMDKDVLSNAAGIDSDSTPKLRPAFIKGWQVKMWGPYPTLIPTAASTTPSASPPGIPSSPIAIRRKQPEIEDGKPKQQPPAKIGSYYDRKVHGMAWKLETFEQFESLQRYESSKYRPSKCLIQAEKGDGSEADDEGPNEMWDGLTFVWAGDPSSPDLEDGEFDLELYQQTTKKYMFGL